MVDKRDDYAALGIPEYWRFDRTGEHHGARLAGDRLLDGVYVPMRIDEMQEGVLQGYSAAIGEPVLLRWEHDYSWDGTIRPPDSTSRPTMTSSPGRLERVGRRPHATAEDRAEVVEDRVRELESEIRRLHDA